MTCTQPTFLCGSENRLAMATKIDRELERLHRGSEVSSCLAWRRRRPTNSMPPTVFVLVCFETVGHPRSFATVCIVAPATRCAGRTAATCVGTVPRAGDMGLAHPAGTVTTRTCHDQTRRRGSASCRSWSSGSYRSRNSIRCAGGSASCISQRRRRSHQKRNRQRIAAHKRRLRR